MARTYLSRRDLATPAKANREMRRAILDWETQRIKLAGGMEFRRSSRVVVIQPRWMPRRLYRYLMGTIFVETRGEQ